MPKDVTVTFEDGTKHVYRGAPDDLTPDQAEARAQKDFGKRVTALSRGAVPQTKPAQKPKTLGDIKSDALRRAEADIRKRAGGSMGALGPIAQGASFNMLDEVIGARENLRQKSENLARQIQGKPVLIQGKEAGQIAADVAREDLAKYAQKKPVTNFMASIGGGSINPLNAFGARYAAAGAGLLSQAGRGAVVGSATGAAYGAGEGRNAQERARNALGSSVVGGVVGGGAPILTRAAQAAGNAIGQAAKKAKTPAIKLDDLRVAKEAAYKAADSAGVSYTPKAVGDLVSNIESEVLAANLNPARHPRAASMLADLKVMGDKPMTLTELDQLRQVIRRDVVDTTDRAEKFFGRKMIDQIDKMIENTDQAMLNSGTAKDAQSLLVKARDLNAKYRKVEAVTGAVEKAKLRAGSTGSGGNIDNATRQNLRVVLEKTPNFTPDERAAIETVVLGSKAQNALRQVGKLSPSGNGLGLMLHTGAALGTGGVSTLVGVGGALAKGQADRMTQQNVQKLLQVIVNGTPQQVAAAQGALRQIPNGPLSSALRKAINARLATSTVAVTSRQPAQQNEQARAR